MTSHASDVVMKALAQTFKDRMLRVFGLNTACIVDIFPTVLPVLEVRENRTDFIFFLEGRTLPRMEFVTKKKRNDLKRFVLHDARLINRDGRAIQTAVIYSGRNTRASRTADERLRNQPGDQRGG